ncbi:MAG: trypsin-like peptidase domain-containing protein [Rhodoluna sp.]|jgi:putative serine protease PepD|nr:trypsin-like peptidase domain-containing protein [Rhodoluna sp.]
MSDYNRQFLFSEANVSVVKPKRSLRQRLAAKTTFLTGTAAVALGALVGAGVGAGVGVVVYNSWTRPPAVVVNDAKSVTWITGAAATAAPSVVTISVSGSSGSGNGSGVFLTSDGFVITNAHVVTLDGSTSNVKLQVKTSDGHVYTAKVVGTDPINDLAVIKVDAPISFTPVQFADSSKINVGDRVVAIGAPLGLANTVTEGIVSALNRTIAVASAEVPESQGLGGLQFFSGSGTAVNLRVIQTDAAINPGNSGGALVDEEGRLIGINVAIASAGSGAQAGNIGVGFAIPSNVAQRIASEIMATGTASHALLGAGVADSTGTSDRSGFSVGAEIKELTKGGAAEKAGLAVGDIVVKFNGQAITTAGELTAAVRQEPAGAEAVIELIRNKETLTLNVVLGDAADLK